MGRTMLNSLISKALAATAFIDERPSANGGELGGAPKKLRKLAKQAFRAGKLSYIELFLKILKRCIYLAFRQIQITYEAARRFG